mgnify:CR=1 FL=1|tara:strand:- start:6703 stop:7092 length:390 start_codon:yes stop_codon:yes gene_type:complete
MDALEELKAAVSMASVKKAIPLPNGKDFIFYMTPMTLAERERAKKMAKTDDSTDFALRLLVDKAMNENNEKRFHVGHIPGLRNALPATLVEKIMLAMIGEEDNEQDEVQEELNIKSTSKRVKKRQSVDS